MKIESVLVFLLGFFSCAFLVYIFLYSGFGISGLVVLDLGSLSSPSDWVAEDDIVVLDDRVVLKVENASVSSYVDSGSMKPFFNEGANGIRVVPSDEDEINVGDIVSFRMGPQLDNLRYQTGQGWLVVHRVVERGVDDEGVYFLTKGDNSLVGDGKIRFEDIEYVTIGIIF